MYIWIGINIDEQLKKIKHSARKIEEQIGFNRSCFMLPLHISLKISFYVDDEKSKIVISDISNFLQNIEQFAINVKDIELNHNICWIRMKSNEKLNQIHNQLDNMLLEKHNIPLHEYDLDYKFHTTLFMDNDELKVKEAFDLVKNFKFPNTVFASRFLIGTSPDGYLGPYKIIKEIVK